MKRGDAMPDRLRRTVSSEAHQLGRQARFPLGALLAAGLLLACIASAITQVVAMVGATATPKGRAPRGGDPRKTNSWGQRPGGMPCGPLTVSS